MNPAPETASIEETPEAAPAAGFAAPGSPSGKGPRDFSFAPELPRRPLTEREKQILRLVCDGLTNAEIALRLGISADTIKSELKRIFRKIEVKNRTQAAVLLVRQGLLQQT